MKTPDGMYAVRAKVVMGVFDLLARAAVLCMKQFNGLHGCTVCTHPGERTASGARIYPTLETYKERTHESILHAATTAQRRGKVVKGVKSILL